MRFHSTWFSLLSRFPLTSSFVYPFAIWSLVYNSVRRMTRNWSATDARAEERCSRKLHYRGFNNRNFCPLLVIDATDAISIRGLSCRQRHRDTRQKLEYRLMDGVRANERSWLNVAVISVFSQRFDHRWTFYYCILSETCKFLKY